MIGADTINKWLGNKSKTISIVGSSSYKRADVDSRENGQRIVSALRQLKEEEGLSSFRDDKLIIN